MSVDPFRLAIAAVPLAAYMLTLALVNLRRRPLLTTGSCDLAALGVALSGVVFAGPVQLFRPDAAAAEFGNYVWVILLAFYWLWIVLVVLLARPRLVVYNISAEELHPVLAETAAELDPHARWAGDSLTLPSLGVQLHLDEFALMRNVSLPSSGAKQSVEGWGRLGDSLAQKLVPMRVQSNPRAVSFFLAFLFLMSISLRQMLTQRVELAEAMSEVLRY